ncbi:hypothetical protein [Haloferula sp.]|uniref:hypothetical protein n=1 Tax=Haloferula sp. TaxID=2497595 RepID=UPI0032A0EB74
MPKNLGVWLCLAALLLLAVSGACYYRFVIWPRDHFREVCNDPDSTDDECREAIHRMIAWNESHDGFVLLETLGDETSVPLLIRSLGRAPEEDRKSGRVECTWGHCRDALIAITGEDFGYDVEKWRAWHRKQ